MPQSVTLNKNKTIIYGTLSSSNKARASVLTIQNTNTGQVLEMTSTSKSPKPFIYELDPGTVQVLIDKQTAVEESFSNRTKMFFDSALPQQIDSKSRRLMYLPRGRLIYVGHWQFTSNGITVYYKKDKKAIALKDKYENLDFAASDESFPQ